MVRGMKTVRGALFSVIGLVTILLWLGPNVMLLFLHQQTGEPQTLREFMPLALLGMCLLSILTADRKGSIYFTPAEVDLLFSAPFTRRELLVYKLSTGLATSLLVSVVFSMFVLRFAAFWLAAWTGTYLTLVAVQLLSTAIVLLGQTMAEHAYTRLRRLVLVVLLTLVGMGISWMVSAGSIEGLVEFARRINHSAIGRYGLAPLAVFGQVITAPRLFPDLLGWGTLAVLIDLGLLGLVLGLDVNYLESAIQVSQKRYRRMQLARQGGLSWATSSTTKWQVPRLPWLGGVGPIAHRQMTTALHSLRGLAAVLLIMAMVMMPTLIMRSPGREIEVIPLGLSVLFLSVFLSRMLPFDFRGDLDHLDWLKSLPFGSLAVALGQVVVPVLLMTVVQLVCLGALALIAGQPAPVLLELAAFTLPVTLLIVALDNLIFLLFPVRLVAATPGDFQHMGRAMVEIFLKMIFLGIVGGLAAGLGGLAYWLGGGSKAAMLATAWSSLILLASLVIPCIAWAYRRFDVSTDTPP
jgi:hypothetical protein